MKKQLTALFLIVFSVLSVFYNECKSTPVDVVYTWVDGNDPAWQKLKEERAVQYHKEIVHKDSNSSNRFRDRQELKYSLRSLHQYAPFVNHIYIVTCGQKPSWIKPHPKITFVHHEEIFQNKDHLPTFNSQAIEAHIHRIPNLSENYIYLNDDFVFTKAVSEHDFYDQDGNIKVFLTGNIIRKDKIMNPNCAYYASLWNMDQFLDKVFGIEKRRDVAHAPYVMKKSVVQQFEADFPEVLAKTSSHPFRSMDDYTLTNGIFPYYALYHEQAVVGRLKTKMIFISGDYKKNRKRLKYMRDKRLQMVCLEDAAEVDNVKVDQQVIKFLEEDLSIKAPWEK